MIRVTFACGHRETVSDAGELVPVCATCGERRVSRTQAPAPTFRGAVRGPSAAFTSTEPWRGSVAPAGPLDLK